MVDEYIYFNTASNKEKKVNLRGKRERKTITRITRRTASVAAQIQIDYSCRSRRFLAPLEPKWLWPYTSVQPVQGPNYAIFLSSSSFTAHPFFVLPVFLLLRASLSGAPLLAFLSLLSLW